MSATEPPASPADDPSMEDILASIRRILSEEEQQPTLAPTGGDEPPSEDDDVLVLEPSMMVPESIQPESEEPASAPVSASPETADPTSLVAPETARAAAASVAGLVATLAGERETRIHREGPTIEDLVRAELRPLLKTWLDTHLPPVVERLVRAEIERVVGRALP